jgi:hypothetical protein
MFRWVALIAGIVFVVAVAGAIISSEPPIQRPQQQTAEKNKTEHSAQKKDVTLWNRWFPDSISLYTLFLVLFTAILAFGGIIQLKFLNRAERISATAAKAAQDSADVARQTLITSNRPWITISHLMAVSPLTWDEKGARLTVNWKIKNVGKSPAFDLSGEADGFIANSKRYATGTELENFCKHLREKQIARAEAGQHQEVLFPDEEISQGFGLLFPREQLEGTMKVGDKQFINPVILVCIDYRSPITNARHATGLAFMIVKPGSEPNVVLAPVADETLNPNQFGLVRSPFGSFAE